jgi:hypothetical protein
MHPKVFDFFACNFHITFSRPMTTDKPFTGASSTRFLANSYPLSKEKTRLFECGGRLHHEATGNAQKELILAVPFG